MTTIAGLTMTSLQGRFTRGRIAARVVRRPNLNGVAVIYGKWGAQPDRFVSVAFYDTYAHADAAAESYRTVEKNCAAGTLITVVDPLGATWNNVAVVDVVPQIDMTATGVFQLTCAWMMVPNSDSP